MDDINEQFDAIIKDNGADQWATMSMDELAFIASTVAASSMHMTHLIMQGLWDDDEENLDLDFDQIVILRAMQAACEVFTDYVIDKMYEEDIDDEDDNEDDDDDE